MTRQKNHISHHAKGPQAECSFNFVITLTTLGWKNLCQSLELRGYAFADARDALEFLFGKSVGRWVA